MNLDSIRLRVRESGLTYAQIAARADVGRSWLDKFMQGKIVDPGVAKITRLDEFLASSAHQSAQAA